MGAVKFCKVPKYEIFDREKVTRIQGMESRELYISCRKILKIRLKMIKKICYNNNVNKKVSFIESI